MKTNFKTDEKVLIIVDNKLTLANIVGYKKRTKRKMVEVGWGDGKYLIVRHENEILRLEDK
ncbi:hypothetical protein BFC20_10650 [Brochothrix thermosphacta]|uniref:hypothetical protein n=1 Tax=Brochothrix thermosphacta TaxID=2756 RepID=UPI000E74EACB|nr:hypothetical protein [Brochothrix thermosphacta]ANZ98130.1 hypothetical protein BFC20_10650 [Brochothrix thermosphacta]